MKIPIIVIALTVVASAQNGAGPGADTDISSAILGTSASTTQSPAPAQTGTPQQQEDRDIGGPNAIQSARLPQGPLLPADATAAKIPAITPYDEGSGIPLVWRELPIEAAMQQVARWHGVRVRVIRSGSAPLLLNGDMRGIDAREILRTVAREHGFRLNEENGAFALSEATVVRVSTPSKPVIVSSTISVPIKKAEEFVAKYFALRSPHGSIYLVTENETERVFRVDDLQPVAVSASGMAKQLVEHDVAESAAVTARPEFVKERAKLLKKRRDIQR